ncbi:MAG: hypothetical protein IKG35_04470, partial [Erysipelotrichaceae bacterium]|nr:hypothetical protein [Erysipelotrichaceae bacterium]
EQLTQHIEEGAEKTKDIMAEGISNVRDTGNELKKKLEKALDKAEEKKPADETYVKEKVTNGDIELTLEGMETVENAKKEFRKKYGYDTEKNGHSDIELKLESSQAYIDAYEQTKKEREKLEGTQMDVTKDMKEKAEKVAAEMKEKAGKVVEDVKESKAGKAVLGDDGKFGKEDADRIGKSIKETILGPDGKLDVSDASRLANDAVEKGVEILGNIKNSIFGKKK